MSKPIRGTQLNRTHPLARGLVGAWLFNEGTGTIGHDISLHGYNGTLNNGITWDGSSAGFVAGFDGTNDYVSVSGADYFANVNEYSIEAWYSTIASTAGTLYGEGGTSSSTPLVLLSVNTDSIQGKTRLLHRDDGSFSNSGLEYTNSGLSDGNLHHVVAVRKASNSWELYSDGVRVATSTSNVGTTTVNSIQFGMLQRTSPLWYLDGSISSIRKWNRALSAEEIAQLYFNPYAMFESHISPALLYVAVASGIKHPIFGNDNIHSAIFGGQLVR